MTVTTGPNGRVVRRKDADKSSRGIAQLDAAGRKDGHRLAPVWVDVRKPHEWEQDKLAEAAHFIPHEAVIADGLPGVDPSALVLGSHLEPAGPGGCPVARLYRRHQP